MRALPAPRATRSDQRNGIPSFLDVVCAYRPLLDLLFANVFSNTFKRDQSVDRGTVVLPEALRPDKVCFLQERHRFFVLVLRMFKMGGATNVLV